LPRIAQESRSRSAAGTDHRSGRCESRRRRHWNAQPSTLERGYGDAHERLRRHWAPIVAAGNVDCWRCGERIEPGDDWALGHDDHDDHDDDDDDDHDHDHDHDHDRTKTKYNAPEHVSCNRSVRKRR
jgi:hypothetical protein